jgi:hypothetical protein
VTRNGAKSLAILVALMLTGIRALGAQTITVSGNPGLLRISSAIAGSDPTSVSNAVTTYTVVTGGSNKTYAISMQLNANMPAGVTLTASLAATTGATSLGAVALDVTARQVVTGIKKNTNATRSITYTLSAPATAGVVANSSRTVTLTIAQFP